MLSKYCDAHIASTYTFLTPWCVILKLHIPYSYVITFTTICIHRYKQVTFLTFCHCL